MTNISLQVFLAFITAFFGLVGLALGLLGIILAPWIIYAADRHLGVLYPKDEILFKGYPLSLSRLCSYGLVIMFRSSRVIQRRVFMNRNDRLKAIENAPRWIVLVTIWVYGLFIVFAIIAAFFGGAMLLVDELRIK